MSSPITEKSGMIFGTNRVGILTLVAALLATGMAVLLFLGWKIQGVEKGNGTGRFSTTCQIGS